MNLSSSTEQSDRELIGRLKHDYATHLARLNAGTTGDEAYRAASRYYEVELLPVLPSDRRARVLDVGCGFGHLIRFCSERGYAETHGVEIDPEVFQVAKAYVGRVAAGLTNADALEFLSAHPRQFDVVTLFDVIEHFGLADALAMLVAIRGALKPGGVAVFRTPNMANLFGAYSRYIDLTHQCGYTEWSLGELLRTAGFAETGVHLPAWPMNTFGIKLRVSRRLHRWFIRLQDRTMPSSFEKNILMWARETPVAEGT